jgi:hypothetical protein
MTAPQEAASAASDLDETRNEEPTLGDRLLSLLGEAREANKLDEDRVPFDILLAGASQREKVPDGSPKKVDVVSLRMVIGSYTC